MLTFLTHLIVLFIGFVAGFVYAAALVGAAADTVKRNRK